jgi:hypothetical protein
LLVDFDEALAAVAELVTDEEAIEPDMEEGLVVEEDSAEVELLGQFVPTLVLTITPADLQSEMAKLIVPVARGLSA